MSFFVSHDIQIINMSCKKINWYDNRRWDIDRIWANGRDDDNERCLVSSAMGALNVCPKGYRVSGGVWGDTHFKGHSSCFITSGPYRRRCYKYDNSRFNNDDYNIGSACLLCKADSVRRVAPKYHRGSEDCNKWLAKFCVREQNITDGTKLSAACKDYLSGKGDQGKLSTYRKQLVIKSCRVPYDYKYGEKIKYKGNWNKVFLPYFRCATFLNNNKEYIDSNLRKICTVDRVKNEQICRDWIAKSPKGKAYAQEIISKVCPYGKLKTDKKCQDFVRSLDGKIDKYVEGYCKGIGRGTELCDCYNSPDNAPGWCLPECLSGHAYQTEAIRTSLKGGGKCTICRQNIAVDKSQLQGVTIKQDCSNSQAKNNLENLYQTCVSIHGIDSINCQYLKDKLEGNNKPPKLDKPSKLPKIKSPFSTNNQLILLFILILVFIMIGSGEDSKSKKNKIGGMLFGNL